MGRRQDGRIEPGQKLAKAISARAWNRAQDAADIVLGDRVGLAAEPGVLGRAQNIAIVKNTTADPVPIFGVLELTGVEISPSGGTFTGSGAASSRAREFVRKHVLSGVMPDGARMFGVALEPILAGKLGRMAVGGTIPCKVKILAAAHNFARSRRNDVTQLISAPCGPIRLVWKESGTGDNKWAAGIF